MTDARYRAYEPHSPMPEGHVGTEAMFRWVHVEAKRLTAAKPWMLVPMREEQLIAVKRTWWMRLVTWWLNRSRRVARAAFQAELAKRDFELWQRKERGEPIEDGTT